MSTTLAGPSLDLENSLAMVTAASGLVPATEDTVDVAIARIELTSDDAPFDLTPEPGFVIGLSGSFALISADGDQVALVGTNDARWLPADAGAAVQVPGDGATFWRIAIGSRVSAVDLDGRDPYTFNLRAPELIGSAPYSPFIVRIGLLPAGMTTSLGTDDEQVVYAFTFAGEVSMDGVTIGPGGYTSPFFDQPDVQAGDGAALIGYIARGATIDLGAN